MAKDVYWPEMKKDVLKHVQSCYSCQKNRPLYQAKGGLLKPLPVAAGPWESISMDFIQGLSMSHGFNAILTIVDRFSKMAYFVPTRKTVLATRGQQWFSARCTEYGEYQLTFCEIGIPDLPGIFGERSSGCPELTLREGQLTIMKQTGKPKESTWPLESTHAIFCQPIKRIGQSTLQWASLHTILVFIPQLVLHHSFWPRAGCQGCRPGL